MALFYLSTKLFGVISRTISVSYLKKKTYSGVIQTKTDIHNKGFFNALNSLFKTKFKYFH